MIDLGQTDDCCTDMPMPAKEPKVRYPTLYFTCDEECEMPEEGTALIKFRQVEEVENTRDPENPKYRYELEVQGFEVKSGKAEKEEEDVGPAFKKGVRELMAKKLSED